MNIKTNNMRPLKELFQLVQKEYKEKALIEEYSHGDDISKGYNGLCYVFQILWRAEIIKTDERYLLKEIIQTYGKTRKTFYTYDGAYTDYPSQFVWRIGERVPRLAWLRKQIKKN